MNFYRRYDKGGSCEIICTSCFRTLGVASGLAAVRKLEARHVCVKKPVLQEIGNVVPIRSSHDGQPSSILNWLEHRFTFQENLGALNQSLAFFVVILLLYALPTIVEFAAARRLNPWLAIILPGDVMGCAWLIVVFRMPWAGLLLYLFLTACEGCLYTFHLVPVNTLPWIVDLVPTLVVVAAMLHAREQHQHRPAW